MLHRIRTSRWKKADAVDITFTAGMNAIVGPNYVGKSSLLSAIFFALGGTSVIPGSMLETTTPGPGKFSVELWFLNYYIIRTKSKAELYENGKEEPIAVGTSVVNRRIGLILGMPVKRFMDLKFARQKKTEKILSMGGTELFNIIQDLTGINDVSKMIEKLSTRSKRTEGAMDFIGFPEEKVEPIKQKIDNLSKVLLDTEALVGKHEHLAEDAEVATQQLRDALERSTEDYARYEKDNKAYKDAFKAVEEANDRVSQLKFEKVKVLQGYPEGSINVLRQSVQNDLQLLEKYEQANRDYLNCLKQAEKAKEGFDSTQVKVDLSASKIKTLTEQLGGKTYSSDLVNAVISELATLAANSNEWRKSIEEAKETLDSGVCPTCHRKYETETEEHRSLLTSNIDSWLKKIEEAAGRRKGLQQTLEQQNELKAVNDQLLSAKAALETWKENLAIAAESVRESGDKVQEALSSIPLTPGDASELETKVAARQQKLKEYDKQILRIEEAERALARANENADKVTKPAEPVVKPPAELRTELTSAIQFEKEVKGTLREAKDLLSKSSAELSSAQQELSTIAQQVERKEKLQGQSKAEQALLKYLRTGRDRFTQDIWASFLLRASRFVRECTSGRVTDLDRDEDGSFRYREGENWFTLNEASGCQLNLMGLAVQMALADVAPCPLNVLVADEPTDSMEDEHSLAAMVALASCGRQVICVTHKDLDRSLFDNVYEIERK